VIVTDASVVLEVLLQTPAASPIEDRILSNRELLHAPHLIDLEVAQVLRRCVSRGEMYPDRARMALDLFARFPITRYSHEPLLPRIGSCAPTLRPVTPHTSRSSATKARKPARHQSSEEISHALAAQDDVGGVEWPVGRFH
jgi:hypothetical protein